MTNKSIRDYINLIESVQQEGVAEGFGLRGTGNPGMPTPYDQGRADAKKGRPYDNPYDQPGEEQEHRNYRKGYEQGKQQGVAEGSGESYIIVRTDAEGKKDVFAGNFDTYEQAQKELDACLAHPLHTKYKQKFEIKRKGGEQGVAEGSTDLVQIEYWQQETMESGRWVKTKPIPRATAEKIVNSFERGEIVDVEQGVAEEQLEETSPEAIAKINQITRK